MPECPEIYIMSLFLKSKVMNKKIKSIDVFDKTNAKMKKIKTKMINNNEILDISTKGKLLWFELSDGKYILSSFGLEGYWSYEETNKYEKLKITFDDDTNLYYIDKLNFGTLEIGKKELLETKINKLGIDILQTKISDNELKNIIVKYKNKLKKDKNIVKILMSQDDIICGIGNYLVAEILYDAKINPHRNLQDLDNDELLKLAHSMRKLVKNAYYHNDTRYTKHYNTFMKTLQSKIDDGKYNEFHEDIKLLKNFRLHVYRQEIDSHGNEVKTDNIVVGRTTYWCPEIQK